LAMKSRTAACTMRCSSDHSITGTSRGSRTIRATTIRVGGGPHQTGLRAP
jgi:hypothetical protein